MVTAQNIYLYDRRGNDPCLKYEYTESLDAKRAEDSLKGFVYG